MRSLLLAVSLALAAAGARPVAGQRAELTNGPLRVRLVGRIQFQFNTTSVDEADLDGAAAPAANTFDMRRLRAAVELSLADWITGLIETDLALGRAQTRQAWMDLAFSDALALRAGQFKKPFSPIRMGSSLELPMIERDVRIRGLPEAIEHADSGGVLRKFRGVPLLGEEQLLLETLGYDAFDMGASLHGRLGPFGYEAGVFNGTGGDRTDENGVKSFAGRVSYRLPGARQLVVGAEASRRDYLEGVATRHGTALGADLEWGAFRQPGVWLIVEGAAGNNLLGGDFRAAQAVATYFVPARGRVEGLEPMLRLSWGDPDTSISGDAGVLLTPGLNLHLFGRNRLMFNWDWYLPEGAAFARQHSLRAQMQLSY